MALNRWKILSGCLLRRSAPHCTWVPDRQKWEILNDFTTVYWGFPGGSVQRIHLTTQETQVWFLVQENPTCHEATKPMHYNYWACALEPGSHNYWNPHTLDFVLHKRNHRHEKLVHCNELELAQTHVHWVNDAMQPSHSLCLKGSKIGHPQICHFGTLIIWN